MYIFRQAFKNKINNIFLKTDDINVSAVQVHKIQQKNTHKINNFFTSLVI